jgi:hypothetical protein
MKQTTVEELRRAIQEVHRQAEPTGRRYALELRRSAIAYTLSERSRGESIRSTASSLSLPYKTLWRWVQSRPGGFRPVAPATTITSSSGSGIELVTAQGHRVEGLSRDDLVILLRALS